MATSETVLDRLKEDRRSERLWLQPAAGAADLKRITIRLVRNLKSSPVSLHLNETLISDAANGVLEAVQTIAFYLMRKMADGSDLTLARNWLWLAACLGSQSAQLRLAQEIVIESRNPNSVYDPSCILDTATTWVVEMGDVEVSPVGVPSVMPSSSTQALSPAAQERFQKAASLRKSIVEHAFSRQAKEHSDEEAAADSELTGLDGPSPAARQEVATGPSQEGGRRKGMVVVRAAGDVEWKEGREVVARYVNVIGKELPLKGRLPQRNQLYRHLTEKWPWAEPVARFMESRIAMLRSYGGEKLRLPPLLLVGPPGSGKTKLLEEALRFMAIPFQGVPCGGSHDSSGLMAVSRGWSTASASAPVQAMNAYRCANPGLILDELDKASQFGSKNGSVHAALLGMMDGLAGYWDSCLMSHVDLSGVSFLASANDLKSIPEALRDRFTILMMPRPGAEHFDTILSGIQTFEARKLGLQDARLLPWISEAEKQWLKNIFIEAGGSIRNLERAYEVLIGEKSLEEAEMIARPN